MQGKRVLIIEDMLFYCEMMKKDFEALGVNHVDTAASIHEAIEILFGGYANDTSGNWANYDIIIVDACVPGDTYNTAGIIRQLVTQGFAGVLVAASSLREYRRAQLKDGCTLDGGSDKFKVPEVVSQHLAATAR